MRNVSALVVSLFLLVFTPIAHAGTIAIFNLYNYTTNVSLGEVDVELYDQDKPVTVKNFINLAQGGYYENGFFHRQIPGFVLQGGGYYAGIENITNAIDPEYDLLFFGLLGQTPSLGNITNEFSVGKFYSNTNWTIAMAKNSDPNSANSQFFFNLANNTSLDNPANSGGFTVFGHTIRGTNFLNYFNNPGTNFQLVNLTNIYPVDPFAAGFTTLPTAYLGTNAPPYNSFFYYTVSILGVQVSLNTNGTRNISWPIIQGLTNNLECTTSLPPEWQVVFSFVPTNAPGTVVNLTDSATNSTRFYRVHVLF